MSQFPFVDDLECRRRFIAKVRAEHPEYFPGSDKIPDPITLLTPEEMASRYATPVVASTALLLAMGRKAEIEASLRSP